MQDFLKRVVTTGALFPGSSVFVLVLGDNILIPEKNIKGIEFQFVGDGPASQLFEIMSFRVATTVGEVTDCDRWYHEGGWIGRISSIPGSDEKRAYMLGIRLEAPRPHLLRVRLIEDGGDDCDVLLTELAGDVVTGVASGTDWQEWRISPASDTINE